MLQISLLILLLIIGDDIANHAGYGMTDATANCTAYSDVDGAAYDIADYAAGGAADGANDGAI